MKKKVKNNTYSNGDWMIFIFLIILAIITIWEGIPRSRTGIFFAVILWFAVIFETFYILNKKRNNKK